jgi:hypothetical protein
MEMKLPDKEDDRNKRSAKAIKLDDAEIHIYLWDEPIVSIDT